MGTSSENLNTCHFMLCFTGLFVLHRKDLMKMMMIENECLNCMQMVTCKLTIENDDNKELWGVTVLHGCMVNWQGGVMV